MSIATVSRVVNGVANKASAQTVARVRAAIEEMGYRPSGAGQALRRRESRLVAVIAANLSNPAMSAMAASTEAALRRAGYVMVLCDSHDRAELQDEYLREMRAQLVSAFVLLGAVDSPVLEEVIAAGEKVLFVNRRHPLGRPFPFVGIDNRRAGAGVARQLTAWGARDILVIHGPLTSSATRERVEAFRTSMEENSDGPVLMVVGAEGPDHLGIGFDLMRDHLSKAPRRLDAIFCLSDLLAYGAARALREAGIAIPRDCRMIGFDDNPLNDWVAPWLSSVRVPYESFGDAVVDRLRALWSGEEMADVYLDHDIVLRDPGSA